MIFTAFYASTDAPQPISLEQVITYVWLGQALLALMPYQMDREMSELMRSGNVVYEMLKPVDLYNFWYCRYLSSRVAPVLLRCVPMFIVAGLFFGLTAPASFPSAMAWLAATVGALILSCALANLLAISMMWTVVGDGAWHLTGAAIWLLIGMIVPLPFFPDWVQPLLSMLPFGMMVDMPFRLYVGHLPPGAVFELLALQLLWAGSLIVLGRALLQLGLRRLVVQGG
jgi:ABC-2 type transport system permease protein